MKTYVIKVGDFYVTSDGTLSCAQSDALRVGPLDAADMQGGKPRALRLRTVAERQGYVLPNPLEDAPF